MQKKKICGMLSMITAEFALLICSCSAAEMKGATTSAEPKKAINTISCGQVITEDTRLAEDLVCPPDATMAIIIGASNITLDLGEHRLKGNAQNIGVFAQDKQGLTIKNGTIDGFNDGIFIINVPGTIVENLAIRNQDITDPNHFIFGVHIDHSQNVTVRNSLFEFPSVYHKSAVEVYASNVTVSNIDDTVCALSVSSANFRIQLHSSS